MPSGLLNKQMWLAQGTAEQLTKTRESVIDDAGWPSLLQRCIAFVTACQDRVQCSAAYFRGHAVDGLQLPLSEQAPQYSGQVESQVWIFLSFGQFI